MSSKKIRIAVAVCSKGHWGAGDETLLIGDLLFCDCEGPEHVVYVNATIPLPTSVEVTGEVESA